MKLDNNAFCAQEIPEINSKIDIPPDEASAHKVSKVPKPDVRDLEHKRFDHEKDRDKWAYHLLLICLTLLVLVYVAETALSVFFSSTSSDFAKTFFEVLKFLTSSLIGFLFAKRTL